MNQHRKAASNSGEGIFTLFFIFLDRFISSNFNFIDFVNSNYIERTISLLHFDCTHSPIDPLACGRLACKMVQVTATHRFTFSILRFLSLRRILSPIFVFYFSFSRSVRGKRAYVVMCVCVSLIPRMFLSINKYSFTFWFTFVEFERPQQGISLPL